MAPEIVPNGALKRVSIRIRGLVQGVGFRPHVARTAIAHGITGHVLNDSHGVLIDAQGPSIDAFVSALTNDAPPLARISHFEAVPIQPAAEPSTGFEIRDTRDEGEVRTVIGPDVSICRDCLSDLFEPGNRRYLHPFVCCTNCGPRYTVARSLPYDRAQTSMAGFELCPDCAAEYADPTDRRFHAEPIACNHCGPRLSHPQSEISKRIDSGEIVAIKGLGGFHLACDARNAEAVDRLRARKQRDGKPFAVMVLNAASVHQIAELSEAEVDMLSGSARPIVIAPAHNDCGLAKGIASGLPNIGLMVAYTPLHYLIFYELAGRPEGLAWLDEPCSIALVMTSANRSGDALITDDETARKELEGIADCIVGHDRTIVTRADDSVVRFIEGAPAYVRRSRGFAPLSVPMPQSGPAVLATGAHLKSTITYVRGDEAFVSQHIGDLDTSSNRAFLKETVDHLGSILEIKPDVIACDLHPDYASTLLAEHLADQWDLPMVRVQHHHAHIAAVAGEHRVNGPILGLALDGHGMGNDGTAWGGELLLADCAQFRRLGHLAPLALAGGDTAAREPWRMAAGVLHALGRADEIALRFADQPQAKSLADLFSAGLAPVTSSAGRYFDAAAGLLGLLSHQSYEGEAAMRLEGQAEKLQTLDNGWRIEDGVLQLWRLFDQLTTCDDPASGASLFHGTLAAALCDWTLQAAAEHDCDTVALGGGCFLNRALSEELRKRLRHNGLKVLHPLALPASDGAISYGQAVVASAMEQ